jgi:hypothetical protein
MEHASFHHERDGCLFQLTAWSKNIFVGEWRIVDGGEICTSVQFYGTYTRTEEYEIIFTITHIGNLPSEGKGRKLDRDIYLKCEYYAEDGDTLSTITPREDWDDLTAILEQSPLVRTPNSLSISP